MLRILVVLSLLFSQAWADTQEVYKYHVDLSLLGKVGNIEVFIDTKDNEYQIEMKAKASDQIAGLNSKKDITYISRGKIINGKFVTDTFEKRTESKKKKTYEIFLFDHTQKKITHFKEKTKKIIESHFDIHTFSNITETKYVHSNESKTLDHYSYYDVLSFLLNFENFSEQETEDMIPPIGANKKNKTFTLKEQQRNHSDQQLLQSKEFEKIYLLRVQTNKNEYELILGLDENGFLQEAVTKNSIFPIGRGRLKRDAYKKLIKAKNIDAN